MPASDRVKLRRKFIFNIFCGQWWGEVDDSKGFTLVKLKCFVNCLFFYYDSVKSS